MYVYGKQVALELLKSNKKAKKAILYKEFKNKEIISMLKKRNINIEFADKKQLNDFVSGNHQGIIMEIEDYNYLNLDVLLSSIKKENPLLLILDHLDDPHNFGAIIRTAEVAGVDGIIIPKVRSVEVNSTVIKTSAGSINYIPIIKVSNLNNTINNLKEEGFWIIGADMDGIDYKTIDYDRPIALVIGNEGKGLSRLIKESCDYIVSIPMKGKINSLNVSVATGILVYEIIRNR